MSAPTVDSSSKIKAPHNNHWPVYGEAQHIGRSRPSLEDRLKTKIVTTAGGMTLLLAMVADGIGGGNYGERAAQLAIDVAFLEIASANASEAGHIPKLLRLGLTRANEAVYKEAKQNRRVRGMGSTATIIAIHDNRLYLANVGDSRAYLVRDGQVVQLTQDHTWAYDMVQSGKLDKEEAYNHPKAEELVRSVGYAAKIDVDQSLFFRGDESEQEALQNQGLPLKAGDRIVICSDGLIKNRHDVPGHYVEADEMYKAVTRLSPENAANDLLQTALDRNVDDNVSVIVLEMPGSKRAFYIPRPVWYGLGGLAAMIAVVLVILLLVGGGNDEPDLTPQPTLLTANSPEEIPSTPTIPPPAVGQARILSAGTGALVTDTDGQRSIETDERIDIESGTFIQAGSEPMTILLSDATWLLLDSGTELELVSVVGNKDAIETHLALQQGKLILQTPLTQNHLVRISNPDEAEMQIEAGHGETVAGMIYSVRPKQFDVDCLKIGPCILISRDNTGITLNEGEWTQIGENVQIGEIGPARYELYSLLAVIVPTSTPTPTPTETPTPTLTPSPRPTLTFTPTPTETPTQVPTDTPLPPPPLPPTNTPKPADTPTNTPEPPPTVKPTDPPTPNPTDNTPEACPLTNPNC